MAQATVSQLQTLFPGINFVRFATTPDYGNTSIQQEEAYVSSLTSKGIVVEIEDHPYPSPGTYTGSQLTTESAWYSQLASYFVNNPYVWFGTMNEPNSGTYGASEAAISTQEAATYNAIRSTGNNNMIMMELDGGGNPGTIGAGFGMTPATYAGMTNIVWDLHYYGWSSNYSTDQTTVTNDLLGSASGGYGIAAAQTIKSADGTVPVIIGEFGNSTTGSSVDPNGNQVINAVLNSGYGYAAWGWNPNPQTSDSDTLTNNGASLTSVGKVVAAAITKAAAASGPSTAPAATASANNTVVAAGASGSITDASGNTWTIAGSAVMENGSAAGYSANVKEIAYVGGTVWQENTTNLWWSWTSSGWTGGTATSPLPAAASSDTATSTLTLDVAEDAWQGDAQFTVSVDGKAVGGPLTASALHGSGDSNVFVLSGAWAGGATHQVQIAFTNDAYGGSAATDRNLYVNGLAFNGAAQPNASATLLSNGASTFTVGGSAAAASAPADTLTLHLAEDAWQGDAQFVLLLDGKAVSTAQAVTASHAAGAWQDVGFAGNFGAGTHTVGVQFTNDAYGGSASTDRNLYVNGIDLNGQHVGTGVSTLLSNGVANFTITTTH